MPSVRSFTVLPALPQSLMELDTIARNMFWCWNHDFIRLFKRIDASLWASCGHNPVKFLGLISQERINAMAENDGFLCELSRCAEKLQAYKKTSTWHDRSFKGDVKPVVAYFSAEFGLHECLPIYSGGLGVLAGDHMKSASDLGIPLVGVGLLYQKGYFRQYLNIDGWQQEAYIENDFYNMPTEMVKDENGKPVVISVEYPGRNVYAQIWRIKVGRNDLYMLDTNIPANDNSDRLITANLYGGDREMRIRQEIMLGIGGLRALQAIGITPTVCHMNEGHAAFMGIERIRQVREATGMSFDEALEATRAGNVFTIHTPVKAGLDEFSVELMDKYVGHYVPKLGISRERFLGLGRVFADNETEPFKMPILAIRLSDYKNGVSELHGEVSRNMWSCLWPALPTNEVPMTSVTNGVHIKSWLSEELNVLFERYLGPNWSEECFEDSMWNKVETIPDEELWRTHQRCKGQMISFARSRLKAQMQRRGTFHSELNWAEEVLDPEALTIGFARRFATYKRGDMLLRDPQRLIKLLTNKERPVQIIFAGKAHPRDHEGKELIRRIVHFATKYNVRRRIVFLEDYDINIARVLVRGVDVWLNNPRRPMEASGTSGMKAAINGALNLSTFDGWWCEGYGPDTGWVIGGGEDYEDPNYQDSVESQALYNLLENEVIPLFYTRASDNLPRGWIYRMKQSVRKISPVFNTHRMVREYTERFYWEAAKRWHYLSSNDMAGAKALAAWKANIASAWPELRVAGVEVGLKQKGGADSKAGQQLKVGDELAVTANVSLGRLSPDDVTVQLYHGPVSAWGDIANGTPSDMSYVKTSGENGVRRFEGTFKCSDSGRQGLAVRILPRNADLVSPYEPGLVLWESTVNEGATINA